MAKKKSPDIKNHLIAAALRLAATHSWADLTLEQIAKAANISSAQAMAIFSTKDDLLTALVVHIDDEVTVTIGKPATKGTARDRLFEVMMARFDVLQKYRPAILGIITAAKRDPSLLRTLIPAQAQAMRKMLALANLKQDGVKEILATAGLLTTYAASLHCWERDDTKDMSRTMATLDKYLRRADKLAEIIFRAI